MIKTLHDLEQYRLAANYVLIKPNRKSNERISHGSTPDDIRKFFIDSSYEPERHATIVGQVVKTPERLIFTKQDFHSSMEWKTRMELQVGDVVIYNFLEVSKAFDPRTSRHFVIDGQVYILVRYDQIYVANRGSEVIVLNGFVLAEPFYETNEYRGKMFVFTQRRTSKKLALIRHIGSHVPEFLDEDKFDDPEVSTDLVGKLVMVDRNRLVPLEYDLHASFEGKKLFWRFQRSAIAGVLEN